MKKKTSSQENSQKSEEKKCSEEVKENKNDENEQGDGSESAKENVTQESSEEKNELELLKEELSQKAKEAAESREQLLRQKAEFENLRKRIKKEQTEFYRYANEGLVRELLVVSENLDRAITSANQNNGTIESLKEGVSMTLQQFFDILKNAGLKPIETLHKPFDPALHEAVSQVETDEHESNTVVEEFQKGYFFKDRVLQHSKVVVSKCVTTEVSETKGVSGEVECETKSDEQQTSCVDETDN